MKIGIITFHWATNYGAVLQAYALQTFLGKLGHDVFVIDYMPPRYRKSIINKQLIRRPYLVKENLTEFFKEYRFVRFRKSRLNLTKSYKSQNELQLNPPECDVYICGSDQVWNPSFTKGGEGKVTTSYFLDFGNNKTIRIAYAVSFGCTSYAEEIKKIVCPLLAKFNAISVRETSGCAIVQDIGFPTVDLMPDPTLLLSELDYNDISNETLGYNKPFTFFYIIHDKQLVPKKMEQYFTHIVHENVVSTKQLTNSMFSIEAWLTHIKQAKYIVTNSFHGVVFSIIYKKQFIAIPVEGPTSGMNDRLFTLLDQLGLKHRIVDRYDDDSLNNILSGTIDWNHVHEKINYLRNQAMLFFLKHIQYNRGDINNKDLTNIIKVDD